MNYVHLGCWKDSSNRAIPPIEGYDVRIQDNYREREDAINKCFTVAKEWKLVLFAVQDGGQCFAGGNLDGYMRYGKSESCRIGKGGFWANDVYHITNRSPQRKL